MKTLLILTCACLFFVADVCSVSGKEKDKLLVNVWLTTGERSRDSSSETTMISVERNAIVLERTSRGRGRKTPPLQKRFRLSPADKRNLLKLIKSNSLLVTDSIELPEEGSNYRYFRISVALTLDGKKGAIKINGPRTAVQLKEEKLYQNTLALVKELFRIINSQDSNVDFVELIREP